MAGSMAIVNWVDRVEPKRGDQFVLRPTLGGLVCICNCQPAQPGGQFKLRAFPPMKVAVILGTAAIIRSRVWVAGLSCTLAVIPGAKLDRTKQLKLLL